MRTVLTGGAIVDLEGGPSEVQSIAIENEKITEIGDVTTGADDTVVDVTGKFLVPGFTNCHAHLGWDGIHDLQDQAKTSFPAAAQAQGDLGERMRAAFTAAFARDCRAVVLIGTDSPQLDARLGPRSYLRTSSAPRANRGST